MKPLPLTEWETLLRSGRGQEVRSLIKSLNLAQVRREQAASLANLAYRLNLPFLAIRILNPIVRPKTLIQSPADPNELAEYAVGLTRIGVFPEAGEILSASNHKANPRILLYRAFLNISQWQYRAAMPLLRNFICQVERNDYQGLVARINLAACLIFWEEVEEAEGILSKLLSESQAEVRHRVIFGNANELMGQVAIIRGEFAKAEQFLRAAEQALYQSQNISAFFVEKWQTILELKKRGWNESSNDLLNSLKVKANKLHHWETIRDCDYFEALANQNEDLIRKLYFGTPFKEFRQRLRWKFDFRASGRTAYQWQVFSGSPLEPSQILSVSRCGSGDVPHRLLFLLSRDFYRPFRLGVIFSQLYPREYFDPNSSYDRVHKSIRRLRRWLEHLATPLVIEEFSGNYRLGSSAPITLDITLSETLPNRSLLQQERLRQEFKHCSFRVAQVVKRLDLSKSTVLQILKELLDSNSVERLGSGRSTEYMFKKTG